MSKKKLENKKQSGKPHQLIAQQTIAYSGPIPEAGDLAGYEEVCPGAAQRIIKMAENQAAHRQ